MGARTHTFLLAPMSGGILALTVVLLGIPFAFVGSAALGRSPLMLPGLLVAVIYVWIWLRFRPSRFIVGAVGLEVVWPLKRRTVPFTAVAMVRLIDKAQLIEEIGSGMRVGAGGLWGGFGWLWTKRHGIVQMYISRTDGFVWIECVSGRPWLITPEKPEAFVRLLASRLGAGAAP